MFKNGLVLSGGGARGIAHAGVLRALEECNILPQIIAGTSAGALIGAFYSAGYKPAEILNIVQKNKFFSWKTIAWKSSGFFKMDAMRKVLENALPADFESLKIPLHVTNTNLITGESRIVSQGPLIDPLLASACVPVVFKPVSINNQLWVDGGVTNNFPVEPLLEKCKNIIGCSVNKISTESDFSKWSVMRIIDQTFHVAAHYDIENKKNSCHIFIEPDLFTFGMFDIDKAEMIYKIGYETAIAALKTK